MKAKNIQLFFLYHCSLFLVTLMGQFLYPDNLSNKNNHPKITLERAKTQLTELVRDFTIPAIANQSHRDTRVEDNSPFVAENVSNILFENSVLICLGMEEINHKTE